MEEGAPGAPFVINPDQLKRMLQEEYQRGFVDGARVGFVDGYDDAIDVIMLSARALKIKHSDEDIRQLELEFRLIPESPKTHTSDLEDVSILELGLSTKTANTLLRGGIRNVGQLVASSPKDLKKIRHFGDSSLKETLAKLSELNIEMVG